MSEEQISIIVAMGFSQQQAQQALALNDGDIERAANFLLAANEQSSSIGSLVPGAGGSTSQSASTAASAAPQASTGAAAAAATAAPQARVGGNIFSNLISSVTSMFSYKMVLLVRQDLAMGKGKACAQCGHAAVGAYREVIRSNNSTWKSWLSNWETFGEMKVALKVNSEAEILEFERAAKAANLPCCIVADAGRTQIAAGSLTVLAIGPAPNDDVDKITGKLKLL